MNILLVVDENFHGYCLFYCETSIYQIIDHYRQLLQSQPFVIMQDNFEGREMVRQHSNFAPILFIAAMLFIGFLLLQTPREKHVAPTNIEQKMEEGNHVQN